MDLKDNIAKYEAANGPIKNSEMTPPISMNFGGPAAQA
jgi:hypothetical protein